MAVASRLVYSSSDVIGDILIVPISDLTSGSAPACTKSFTASAAALGAETSPSLPLWDAQWWKLENKQRQRVLSVQVVSWVGHTCIKQVWCATAYWKAHMALGISHWHRVMAKASTVRSHWGTQFLLLACESKLYQSTLPARTGLPRHLGKHYLPQAINSTFFTLFLA